jgi:hypothetical protein
MTVTANQALRARAVTAYASRRLRPRTGCASLRRRWGRSPSAPR